MGHSYGDDEPSKIREAFTTTLAEVNSYSDGR